MSKYNVVYVTGSCILAGVAVGVLGFKVLDSYVKTPEYQESTRVTSCIEKADILGADYSASEGKLYFYNSMRKVVRIYDAAKNEVSRPAKQGSGPDKMIVSEPKTPMQKLTMETLRGCLSPSATQPG